MITYMGISTRLYLEPFGVSLEGLHDHDGGLEHSLQPGVVSVEPVHGTRHVDQEPKPLGLLLRRSGLWLLLGPLLVDGLFTRDPFNQPAGRGVGRKGPISSCYLSFKINF